MPDRMKEIINCPVCKQDVERGYFANGMCCQCYDYAEQRYQEEQEFEQRYWTHRCEEELK